jgi:hypothetical protein
MGTLAGNVDNVFIGYDAGGGGWTGSVSTTNVGVGNYVMDDAMDGALNNTALGHNALSALTTGDNNVAIGSLAGQFISTGLQNTFVGSLAGKGLTGGDVLTGNSNTAIGYNAGVLLQSGANFNTFVGAHCGNTTTTGTENVIIGYNCEAEDATATKQIIIGIELNGTADDAVFIGDSGDHIRCDWGTDATWDKVSDERKKNISGDSQLGLEFINDLRTVAFTYKAPCDYPKEWTSYNADKKEPRTKDEQHGMLAQDVKKALDNAGIDTFAGWSADPDGCQRIGESAFVIPLIKAVQELSAKVEELEAKLK